MPNPNERPPMSAEHKGFWDGLIAKLPVESPSKEFLRMPVLDRTDKHDRVTSFCPCGRPVYESNQVIQDNNGMRLCVECAAKER